MSNYDIDDIEKMLELKTEFHASPQLEERILSAIPDEPEETSENRLEGQIKEMPSRIDLKPKISFRWFLTGIAAAIAVLVLTVPRLTQNSNENICYMVIDGKRITDEKAVITNVEQSLKEVLSSQDVPDVENELHEVFNN